MIRFKKDDGSSYPDWEEKGLDSLTERIIVGLATSVTPYYRDSGIPILRNLNIKENYLDDSDLLFLDEEYAKRQKNKMIKKGDVLTVHTGSNIGLTCLAPDKYEGALSFTTLITTPNQKLLNSQFLCQFMNSKIGRNRINALTTAGGKPNLNSGDLVNLKVPTPCLEEQKKIAGLLSAVDDVISASEKEVVYLEEQKKGIMQKIFSQEIRFKAEDGSDFPDWEIIEFGSIISEFSEKTKKENEDVLLSSAINGMFLNSELFGHQRGSSNKGYRKIKKNMLILSAQNLHLGNANVNIRFEHGIVSPAYKVYEINGCNPMFMYYWIKREKTKNFFLSATTPGASECRRNVDWDALYSQKIELPCEKEQQKIIDFLIDFDTAIKKSKEELECWKGIKKGLLQQLFE